jgi:hypothetical protein
MPSCREAEEPLLRRETDTNSGGLKCATDPVAMSGKDSEVHDGSFA